MAQSDVRPTGDQEVAGSIPARSGNIFFMETGHGIFSMVILSLPLADSRRAVVSFQQKTVYKYWLTA